MELDKRNKKRVTIEEVGEDNSHRFKKLKGVEEDGATASACTGDGDETTEEEVEEFYAILRRMSVAVKYFNDKGRVGKKLKDVLEQAEVTVVHDDRNAVDDDNRLENGCAAVNKSHQEVIIINEGLDLNAVAPEAADGSDA